MNAPMRSERIERVVEAHDQLGETPLWCDRAQKLWWVDIEQPKLQAFDSSSGEHHATETPGTYLGSQALTRTRNIWNHRYRKIGRTGCSTASTHYKRRRSPQL